MEIRIYIRYSFTLRVAARPDETVVLRAREHPLADPVLDLEDLLVLHLYEIMELVGHVISKLLADVDILVGLHVLSSCLNFLYHGR